MLVITRKANQSLIIGDNIELTILEVSNGNVRIGINAPKNIKIIRKEIIDQVRQTNIESIVNSKLINLDDLDIKINIKEEKN